MHIEMICAFNYFFQRKKLKKYELAYPFCMAWELCIGTSYNSLFSSVALSSISLRSKANPGSKSESMQIS